MKPRVPLRVVFALLFLSACAPRSNIEAEPSPTPSLSTAETSAIIYTCQQTEDQLDLSDNAEKACETTLKFYTDYYDGLPDSQPSSTNPDLSRAHQASLDIAQQFIKTGELPASQGGTAIEIIKANLLTARTRFGQLAEPQSK